MFIDNDLKIKESEWNRVKRIHQESLDEIKNLKRELTIVNSQYKDLYNDNLNLQAENKKVCKELENEKRIISLLSNKLYECFRILERYGLGNKTSRVTALDLTV